MKNKIILLIVSILFFLTCLFVIAGDNQGYYSWTKAIYDGEYIQDYLIECDGNHLIKMSPIGDPIYVGNNWDKIPVDELCNV